MSMMKIKKTGQFVHTLPWMAQTPAPWNRETHTRVGIPCEPTHKGSRMIEQVMRNDKLVAA